MANVAKKLATLVGKGSKRPTTYTGTVVSVGGRYRVLLDGATETTLCLPEVKAITGDRVTVEIRNHVATVKGNVSHPAANDEEALSQASIAADAATQAQTDAGTAAQAATTASQAATNAQQSATTAAGAATSAQASATSAATNAATANQAANKALVNLAVIEDVTGTLTWISEHGSYVLTTDTTVQDGTVYFELDSGDYVPIATPDPSANPSQEGWYVLDVTDSQSDYIMAHLAVTSAGLWVLPSGIGQASDAQHAAGYKALLASNGMSIFDGSGMIVASYGAETAFYDGLGSAAANVIAKFGRDGARIGALGGGRVEVDSDGLDVYGYANSRYARIATLNNPSTGLATIGVTGVCISITESSQGGSRTYVGIWASSSPIVDVLSAEIGGQSVTVVSHGNAFECPSASVGDVLTVSYTTSAIVGSTVLGSNSHADGDSSLASGVWCDASGYASQAFGESTANGNTSHAEGNSEAFGIASHSEGYQTKAIGDYSHAGGYDSEASGRASTAIGTGTKASSASQAAIGRYNVEDTQGEYAFVVGNGSPSNRSNAFAVGWDGSLYANNHTGAIGETKVDSATVSVKNNSGTSIASVVLDPGTWSIEGNVGFAENSTGRRIIDLATGSGSVTDAVLRQTGESKQAVSGGITASHTGWITTRTSRTTVYLNVYQNSGAALSVTGYIRAMRIQ